jgi:hypothetical protein
MVKKKGGRKRTVRKSAKLAVQAPRKFEADIKNLSEHELKELLLIHMYKNALLRAQLEAVTQILIKNKLTTYEEVWKDTNENFKNTI